jgi:hypothetical protein
MTHGAIKFCLEKVELQTLLYNKKFEIMEWIYQKGHVIDSDFYYHCSDVASLEWLKARSVKIDKPNSLKSVILLNRPREVLNWFIENETGIINGEAITSAGIQMNDLETLEWLLDFNQFKCNENILLQFIASKKLEAILLIINNCIDMNYRFTITEAVEYNIIETKHKELIKWYYNEGEELINQIKL